LGKPDARAFRLSRGWERSEEMGPHWGAVERVAASGRLGRPVFLRVCWGASDPLPELALALAAARRVFQEAPAGLFARGTLQPCAVEVIARFPSGASALLTCGPGDSPPDWLLLGSHGALFTDAAELSPYQREAAGPTGPVLTVDPADQAALEQALQAAAGGVQYG